MMGQFQPNNARLPRHFHSGHFFVPSSAGIAQLVEHLVYTEAVGGSSPSSCTIYFLPENALISLILKGL